MRAGKQPLDLFPVSVGAFVVQKSVDLGNGRWEADQIEAQAAQKRDTVGLRLWPQPFFFQASQDELIDRGFDPGFVFDLGQ
jgi:hypothetical protein